MIADSLGNQSALVNDRFPIAMCEKMKGARFSLEGDADASQYHQPKVHPQATRGYSLGRSPVPEGRAFASSPSAEFGQQREQQQEALCERRRGLVLDLNRSPSPRAEDHSHSHPLSQDWALASPASPPAHRGVRGFSPHAAPVRPLLPLAAVSSEQHQSSAQQTEASPQSGNLSYGLRAGALNRPRRPLLADHSLLPSKPAVLPLSQTCGYQSSLSNAHSFSSSGSAHSSLCSTPLDEVAEGVENDAEAQALDEVVAIALRGGPARQPQAHMHHNPLKARLGALPIGETIDEAADEFDDLVALLNRTLQI